MAHRSSLSTALRSGLVAAAALASSIAPAAGPASAAFTCPDPVAGGIHLELSNPHVGDQLPPGGGYTINGIAYDPQSTAGTGVGQVTLAIDNFSLGNATLGLPSPGQNPKAGFSATVQLPKPTDLSNSNKTHFLTATAYPDSGGTVTFWTAVSLGLISSTDLPPAGTCALMSSNNRPTTTAAPAPAPAPAQPAPVANPAIAADGQTLAMQAPDLQALFQTAFGDSAAVQWAAQHNVAIGAPAATAAAAPPALALAPVVNVPLGVQLTVQNPHAGDTLPVGSYVVNGIAFDPSDPATPGISRVQVYLDSRDNNGTLVGEGQVHLPNPALSSGPYSQSAFAVTIKTNTGMAGAHGLYVYADANSGASIWWAVPVLIPSNPT